MCTAILSVEPGRPTLVVGVRDELTDRSWQPPARHWPDYPALVGGRDLLAGGTWLAVDPEHRRVACVLNGRGRMAPAEQRESRGTLPLRAASGQSLEVAGLARLDPFHLLTIGDAGAVLRTWDGARLAERNLGPGLHMVVNSGLAADLTEPGAAAAVPDGPAGATPNGQAREVARIGHFLRRFRSAARPVPVPGKPVPDAWADWFDLVNGDGLALDDDRALILRRDLPDGRVWGTTSLSLVALGQGGLRYDFTGSPGAARAWYPVLP
ncbi:MAG: NRDE family protein [Streptosporangiaceae bacterium]